MNNSKLLNLIRIKRLEKGYSQEYVSTKLNISQSAYSKLESGKTKLGLSCLAKLSSILDFDFTKFR